MTDNQTQPEPTDTEKDEKPPFMDDKTYTTLKWVIINVFPPLIALVLALGEILYGTVWHDPMVQTWTFLIAFVLSALAAFLASVVGVNRQRFYKAMTDATTYNEWLESKKKEIPSEK